MSRWVTDGGGNGGDDAVGKFTPDDPRRVHSTFTEHLRPSHRDGNFGLDVETIFWPSDRAETFGLDSRDRDWKRDHILEPEITTEIKTKIVALSPADAVICGP